jgi:glycosyltransferase involved in cell wall biosynthesis
VWSSLDNPSPSPNPLVSVCVICYNHAPYLADLFNSILAQTYTNLELIFVDDCSPDASFEVAKSFEPALRRHLPRVELLRNSVNKGMHLTGEVAASLATGDFICNMDGDDYYLPQRISTCLNFFLAHPQIDAVHSDFFHVVDGKISDTSFWKSQTVLRPATGWAFQELLNENTVAHLTLMLRKECYRRSFRRTLYHERSYMMSDYPSILTMSKLTPIGYISGPLAFYRILSNSASHSAEKKAAFISSIYKVRQDARLGLL